METGIMEILRRRFPGRESFTDAEIAFASELLGMTAVNKSRITPRARFVPLGEVIRRHGKVFRCVERPPAGKLMPCDACSGCGFAATGRYCEDLQCHRFDRRDDRSVWFREEPAE